LSAIFACIDTDGNGLLQKEEVLAAIKNADEGLLEYCRQIPGIMPLLDSERWESAFMAIDTNEDGMVSWFEFVRFFAEPAGATPRKDDSRYADVLAAFFCMDQNKNGFLEKEEVCNVMRDESSSFRSYVAQMPSLFPLLGFETWEEQFKALDTNQDGRVCWHEFCSFFSRVCRPA